MPLSSSFPGCCCWIGCLGVHRFVESKGCVDTQGQTMFFEMLLSTIFLLVFEPAPVSSTGKLREGHEPAGGLGLAL